jgi:CBS domain-containing protein
MKTQVIADVMTADPKVVPYDTPVVEVAQLMRNLDVGDVLVADGDQIYGIVTDRDITLRSTAAGQDPTAVSIGEICSRDVISVAPNDDVAEAVQLMQSKAVRRLPVVEGGRPVGIVSLGDLAVERDPRSALGKISAAPPNN